ncbi:MAG: DUF2723 domain-containing protein, partial [bacterium]|nr:DUF2723 domain-containing protein [bacterium]
MEKVKELIFRDIELSVGGAITFITALIIYFITVAPTVSYWDCGEFIACSVTLGIPHPPGAPLFLLMGKIFSMLPFGSDIAYRVNLLSVFTSAATIFLLYLIIVQLIRSFAGKPVEKMDKFIAYVAAATGALCYAFTDSFWFNAVEAEVYALSTFFTVAVVWFTLKWAEDREENRSIISLIAIAYLLGLSYGVHLLSFLVVPSILLLILFYKPRIILNWKFWSFAVLLFFVGASTYYMIYIRTQLHPFINENDPSNLGIWYYLNREQYGSESLIAGLFNRAGDFWEYQIKFMYLRYFGWNFIGKGLTTDNMGFIQQSYSTLGLMGLPFITGIFGFIYHFVKDWKKALSIFFFFLFSGIVLVIYLNQKAPQPRERDYVYIGSFMAYSMWIGLGAYGLMRIVKSWLKGGFYQKAGIYMTAAMLFIINPVNQFQHNFEDHDRRGNYLAWDYSYNLLTNCEPNAILFTNGDNDTFPLWYLQEVEGIRKDVRVVCLSLLNTNWFIYQLKHYEPKVNINLTDEQIWNIKPQAWNRNTVVQVPVHPVIIQRHYAEYGKPVPENADSVMNFTVPHTMTVGQQTGLQVKDMMVLHIFSANMGQRPIYFALTVANSNMIGIRQYLRQDGIVWKITPVKNPELHEKLLYETVMEKFQYRGLKDKDVFVNYGSTKLMVNYRNPFDRLANHYQSKGQRQKVLEVLNKHIEEVPFFRMNDHNNPYVEQMGRFFYWAGEREKFRELMLEMLDWEPDIPKPKRLEYANLLYTAYRDTQNAQIAYERLLE